MKIKRTKKGEVLGYKQLYIKTPRAEPCDSLCQPSGLKYTVTFTHVEYQYLHVCAHGQRFSFKMLPFRKCGNMDGMLLLFELSKHFHLFIQQDLLFFLFVSLDLSLHPCSKRYLQWMGRGWGRQPQIQIPHNPLDLLFWHQSTHLGAFGSLQLISYS